MKTLVFHSACFALIGLVLSPLAVAHASSSSSDRVHFCLLIDFEQWERDRPRSAAKRLASLNVGEPRTVRMIYFLPNDRPYRAEVVNSIKTTIRQVQTFYAEQMQAHGYGNKTFRFETDAQGEPLVHRVDGRHSDSYYLDHTFDTVYEDLEQASDLNANIYFIVVDNSIDAIDVGVGQRAGGTGHRRGKDGGVSLLTTGSMWAAVHELGHAFGLHHDFNDGKYIMSYGPGQDRLSACSAGFLVVHPYFNPAIPIKEAPPPTIELISPRTYPTRSGSVPVQLGLSDSEGLHQVLLLVRTREGHAAAGFPEVKACRGLAGEKEPVVEFEYDGVIPSFMFTSRLSNFAMHPIYIEAVDTDGNVSDFSFSLVELSPYRLASFSGHADEVRSVSFSPDGSVLASGSGDGTIELWEVATGINTATLSGHRDVVSSVSFSPDGSVLASGSWDGTIELWEVATGQKRTTLSGHIEKVTSVSFSPDGSVLASGSWDGTIELWEVATGQKRTTLSGHRDVVSSVSFSPDGSMIVSGSWDGTIELWEVATGQKRTTLSRHRDVVSSVSFSPDGSMIVSGSWDGAIELWEVATGQKRTTLSGHMEGVTSVSFSPDGSMIVSSSWDGAIELWEVATGQKRTTLSGHTGAVTSVSFLPDGTTIASGSLDGTVQLWDVSEWTGSRPHTVVKTSGDDQQETEQETTTDGQSMSQTLATVSGEGQEGPASTQLDEPFVVSVVDQDGSALAGVDVTFAVTAGGGMLSATTDTNPCTVVSSTSSTTATTDANGQAATRLTLGSEPGTNTVAATVEGLEPVTFTATAADQAMPHGLTKVCGDDQEGTAGALLAEPFVVSVVDEDGAAMAGVNVSFTVTAGGGTLSSATATTNADGRARTWVTLGSEVGTNTVEATVEGLEPVTFTAIGQESPLASLFDAFLGGGKRVALPDSPQLAQNAPNPFNSQTVLSYFLLEPGPVRLEVFALSGQRVAVLHQGPQQAGHHRLHWNGRDDAGRLVASGAYLYRLVTDEVVLTRKLILLR